MMYDILHGRYDSETYWLQYFLYSSTLYDPCSTTIHNQFLSIFFFVNTAFLWNTVPYDIVSLSAPKRYTQFSVMFNFSFCDFL